MHPTRGARWIGALLILAFLAGPGFFTLSLITALYRDLPHQDQNTAEREGQRQRSLAQMDYRHLSPVSEIIIPNPAKSAFPTDLPPQDTSDNPVKAYLTLTGTSDFRALPVNSTMPGRTSADATYRTVCVRLCDGSYFPISDVATPGQFAAHEAQCQSRCGSPARLFVYRKDRETPLQMRDLSGNSYLELKTAFLFHTAYDAGCSCRAQPWTLASQDRHRRYAEVSPEVRSKDLALPAAIVARQPAADEFPLIADTTAVASRGAAQLLDAGGRSLVVAEASSTKTLVIRTALVSENALPGSGEDRSDRIAAVAERSDFVASLKVTPGRAPVRLAEAPKPQLSVAPNFVTFNPAAYEIGSAPSSVAMVGLAVPTAQNAQRSASDILMRNLNPQF